LKQEFGFTLAQLVLPLGLSLTFLLVSCGEAKTDQVIGHSDIEDLNREVKACGWARYAETWAGQDGLQAQGDLVTDESLTACFSADRELRPTAPERLRAHAGP
jgi:hypothetical protein